ncbi:MAG TPA: hypothetical protein VI461_04580 [Chitinophagaceae bacterium]|nr:hypothetical protein [Chitinophagaceae bacterium]
MQPRNLFAFLLPLLVTVSLFSCSKDGSSNESLFYGAWKTSYGDTILFAKENGKNILTLNYTMNPSMPVITKNEFKYSINKLALKYSFSTSNEFKRLESFAWVQPGKVFTVQGVEWFNFLSSTLTVFTFTKNQ